MMQVKIVDPDHSNLCFYCLHKESKSPCYLLKAQQILLSEVSKKSDLGQHSLARSFCQITAVSKFTGFTVLLVPFYMGLDARKPVFGVSNKVRFKPVSSSTEAS